MLSDAIKQRKAPVFLSADDRSELTRLYATHHDLSTTQIAQRFNVSRATVHIIARREGVALRRKGDTLRRLSDADAQALLTMYVDQGMSPQAIARALGRCETTVYRRLRSSLGPDGLRERPPAPRGHRCFTSRSDLFADPLTEEELWLFGLLLADGSTDGRYTVDLRLTWSDRAAVESARTIAGSTAPITREIPRSPSPSGNFGQPLACWRLHSADTVERLVELGMVQRKSLRDDVHVPKRVAAAPAFWRGLIDGDGTVTWHRKRRPDGTVRSTPWLQLLGGKQLLEQWAVFVTGAIAGPRPRVRPKPEGRILHQSVLSGSRAWHMLDVLYSGGGPALARKLAMARTILSYEPPIPKPLDREDAKRALRALDGRMLSELPVRYTCGLSGLRLGPLVQKARAGQRPDLHELFDAYDPDWRKRSSRSSTARRGIA